MDPLGYIALQRACQRPKRFKITVLGLTGQGLRHSRGARRLAICSRAPVMTTCVQLGTAWPLNGAHPLGTGAAALCACNTWQEKAIADRRVCWPLPLQAQRS